MENKKENLVKQKKPKTDGVEEKKVKVEEMEVKNTSKAGNGMVKNGKDRKISTKKSENANKEKMEKTKVDEEDSRIMVGEKEKRNHDEDTNEKTAEEKNMDKDATTSKNDFVVKIKDFETEFKTPEGTKEAAKYKIPKKGARERENNKMVPESDNEDDDFIEETQGWKIKRKAKPSLSRRKGQKKIKFEKLFGTDDENDGEATGDEVFADGNVSIQMFESEDESTEIKENKKNGQNEQEKLEKKSEEAEENIDM